MCWAEFTAILSRILLELSARVAQAWSSWHHCSLSASLASHPHLSRCGSSIIILHPSSRSASVSGELTWGSFLLSVGTCFRRGSLNLAYNVTLILINLFQSSNKSIMAEGVVSFLSHTIECLNFCIKFF